MRSRLRSLLCVLALPTLATGVLAHPGMHETIETLSERIREAPGQQALHIERGIAYSEDGLLGLALADFRKAETLGDRVQVALDLGVLHYRSGAYEQARESLTRYLTRFPGHAVRLGHQ